MKNKFNSSILSSSGRLFVAGLAALTLLGARLNAQYVSTVISNGLQWPSAATVDASGNIYITDSANNRIKEFVPGSGNVTVLAGMTTGGYNNATGTAAQFFYPYGIVYTRGGLVVSDQNNQVLRFISLTSDAVTTLAGVYTGQYGTGGYANGAANTAQFSYPAGLAVDSVSNIYIADPGNSAIRVLSTANMVPTLATTPFNYPAALAVDNNNNLWVADSGNNQIYMISNGVVHVMAGTGSAGTNDSLIALNAEFNAPSGVLWDNINKILVISDTLNDTIRSLYWTTNQGVAGYAVQTLAGIPGVGGLVNGALGTSEFFEPYGLCVDATDYGYYVADSGNNVFRVLQPTQPPPPPQPIANPVIGYVTYPGNPPLSQFNAITEPISTFNNAVLLAIEQLDPTVETYMSYGPTGSVITPPSSNTDYVAPFTATDSGQPPGSAPVLNIPVMPALTLETISEAPGRPSSSIVSVQIDFVTANPNIIGSDAADILLSNITVGAEMYYALDNSTNSPTNDGSYGIGPIISGTTLALNITSNVNLKVRAFAPGFAPSGTVSQQLTVANFVGNQLTFGFASGNSSSKFMTAAGRYHYAPVTLTLLSGATIYSLQFNLNATNNGGAPPENSSEWQFQSFLSMPVTINGASFYTPINPGIVVSNTGVVSNGMFTNDNLLGIAWIEIYPETNLYPTSQDLIAYSLAHDQLFTGADGQAVVGAFSFPISGGAALGDTYTIEANQPSATTYLNGATAPTGVLIQTPTNGSLTNGAINAIKTVTVGVASYLVGDAYPFNWFNAGDFGDSNLLNDDVIEVFQSAIYGFSTPPANSDYFDAMDSADTGYNFYDTSDTAINNMQHGDGCLNVNDVYVTLKRSLDTNLTWWIRNWSGGVETYTVFTNFISSAAHAGPSGQPQGQTTNNTPVYITVEAGQVQSGSNLTVQVPVQLWAANTNYPLRVFMLNVEIDPLDGSPPITNAISFSASANLGSPLYTSSQGPNNYGAAWLSSTVAGVGGTNVIGSISVTLPPNVTTNSAYLVHFDHFSASPNGIALFATTVQDGLITVGNLSGSSWGDGISDAWRLLWFGTLSNPLSAADADPDGDGASNWEEYVAGTNPLNPASVFECLPGSSSSPSGLTLQWSSAVNKYYSVQRSATVSPGKWTTLVSNILGNGQTMQWTDTNATGSGRFYRALVQ